MLNSYPNFVCDIHFFMYIVSYFFKYKFYLNFFTQEVACARATLTSIYIKRECVKAIVVAIVPFVLFCFVLFCFFVFVFFPIILLGQIFYFFPNYIYIYINNFSQYFHNC